MDRPRPAIHDVDVNDGSSTRSALTGLRVVDLTVARAGPHCVRQLSDWGADVIRIDSPRDDVLGNRRNSDNQNLHRNKRSLSLNLKGPADLETFYELVRSADVLVENMRSDVKFRLQVDYATLEAINPRLVYGSISGFGQSGPCAHLGGVDQVAQGMGGLMSVTGEPGGVPMRAGIPVTDLAAGLYLAIGILAALRERDTSGKGQWVHTSLLEAAIGMLDFQATRWTIDGEAPRAEGNHHPTLIPAGCFQTSDGAINVAASSDKLWRALCNVIGCPDRADDPRFATGQLRSRNRTEINEVISAALATNTCAHWSEALQEEGIPVGTVYTVDAMFADPQVEHLAMTRTVDHHELGPRQLIRSPINMSRSVHEITRAAPDPGQDSSSIRAQMSSAEGVWSS
jgi:formyl-CoA transferase